MEEGAVTSWLIAEGDAFKKGEEICEIESSKIANALEAPFDGTLRRIIATPDENLPVGALIAVASVDHSVSDSDIDAHISEQSAAPGSVSAPPPRSESVATSEASGHRTRVSEGEHAALTIPDSLKSGADDSRVLVLPKARKLASRLGINLHNVNGTGRGNRISVDDIHAAIEAAGGSLTSPESVGEIPIAPNAAAPAATPVAKRLATSLGVKLADCEPTGARGRITKQDVELASKRLGNDEPEAALPGSFTEIPFSGMRKTIAHRLQTSKQQAPHVREMVDCNIDALMSLRRAVNDADGATQVSVNDFVIRAVAVALSKNPALNVQFDESRQVIRQYADADVAVAVALPDGLITPIVCQANRKSVASISLEVRELVSKARSGSLKADEYQGGTFTISNLGMYGIRQFDSVINPPQCAILSVGAAEQRVCVRNGSPAVATLMTIVLSFDHRIIDGATAAVFLQSLQRLLEQPALMGGIEKH